MEKLKFCFVIAIKLMLKTRAENICVGDVCLCFTASLMDPALGGSEEYWSFVQSKFICFTGCL